MPSLRSRFLPLLALSLPLLAAPSPLALHATRDAPTDLAVTGLLSGAPAAATRFIRWSALAKLPSSKLRLTGEFVPGEQEVTVVFLADLWAALPHAAEADTLLAACW